MKLKHFATTTQRINTSKQIMRNTNLTHLEKNLANALLVYHLNNRTGQCNPTVATLADELGPGQHLQSYPKITVPHRDAMDQRKVYF